MKRFVRLLCALLLALGALPVDAAGSVRLKDSSCDFVSGYYVVYDYNGTELRSDLLGPNTNYDLWKQLSTADKKAVLTVFAFGPGWFQEQFGDNTAKMNDWWNDASGWAGAREVLRQRIAAREFPVATACFSGSYQDKSRVELPQVEHPPTEAYCFLPEVKEYYDLCAEMEATWDLGSQALTALKKTKGFQVGVAVTAMSGDLISLICERALVPAITPGGLSALAPSLSGELLSLADKMTGLSDSVIEKAVGKRVDAGTARKIIDECWQIIELNDQYANQCIQHFLSLKGRKADAYQRAADAVSAYIEENGTLGESAAQRAHDLAYVSVSASVPSYTDREELDAFRSLLNSKMALDHRSLVHIIDLEGSNIMNILARCVLEMYTFDNNPDDISRDNLMRQAIELIAKFPTIIAYAYNIFRHSEKGRSLHIRHPKEKMSIAENFLYMIKHEDYTELDARMLDLLLIIQAEHGGGNNSTFTVRVTSSTRTDT